MVPIGLTLLFLTGVGPLIAWRKATPSHLRYQFTIPLIAMAVDRVLRVGLHKRSSTPTSACRRPRRDALAPLVLAMNYLLRTFAIVSKKYGPSSASASARSSLATHRAGVLARHRDPQAQHRTGRGVRAASGMVLRGKRRYGGYLVHLGIMLMFFGWAGSAYQKEKTAKLGPGQTGQDRQATPCASTSSPTRRIGRRRW